MESKAMVKPRSIVILAVSTIDGIDPLNMGQIYNHKNFSRKISEILLSQLLLLI